MAKPFTSVLSAACRRKGVRPLVRGLMLALVAMEAHAAALAPQDIGDLSLEELATIQATSVSRRPESLSGAASSIFVISGAEIHRAGVTPLPEALRLAPNLQVARVDARNYAVTARGFNNPFENTLLVLIDGRTVYSPLFSGVFRDVQDVVPEDVERIEVISGPGATPKRIRKGLELSLIGQNLLDPRHAEYGSAPGRSEYERAVLLKLVWNL